MIKAKVLNETDAFLKEMRLFSVKERTRVEKAGCLAFTYLVESTLYLLMIVLCCNICR